VDASDRDLQQYLFDLHGYLVIRHVLKPAEVAELNRLIDAQQLPSPREKIRFGSAAGKHGPDHGFLNWGEPFCRLLDHEAIMPMLRLRLGDCFRLDRLYGIRLDTPSERGRVTAELVKEVRARLDQAGFTHVKIVVSGGLNPERIAYFKEAGARVDSYAVGSYISGATPIDFTGDIKEIDGQPIAKRGRIPGLTDSPRLRRVDLAPWRDGAAG